MTKLEQAARQLVTNWDSGLTIHDELDALREALAEQAECPHGVDDGACKECYMEQAEQEPVAWMRLNEKSECEAIEYIGNVDEHLYLPPSCQWLYTSPVLTMQQVEPKPVAKVGHLHQSIVEACGLPMSTPLYAAPVRTKDLTDDEIDEIFEVNRTVGRLFQRDFARAVIAKFKEKNK